MSDWYFDEGPLTAAEVAAELEADGYPAGRARQMVTDYIADYSARIGVDTSRWGLDRHDVGAIIAAHSDPEHNDSGARRLVAEFVDDAMEWQR